MGGREFVAGGSVGVGVWGGEWSADYVVLHDKSVISK